MNLVSRISEHFIDSAGTYWNRQVLRPAETQTMNPEDLIADGYHLNHVGDLGDPKIAGMTSEGFVAIWIIQVGKFEPVTIVLRMLNERLWLVSRYTGVGGTGAKERRRAEVDVNGLCPPSLGFLASYLNFRALEAPPESVTDIPELGLFGTDVFHAAA